MAIDPAADRERLDPDDDGLDADAEERAADEGMAPPEADPETWGELESQKLDEDARPQDARKGDEIGTDGADISGPVPGDD